MKKIISILLLSFVAAAAHAGNAAPLGMELDVATLGQVRQQLGGKTAFSDAGISKYTNGRMLEGNGGGLDVEGLSRITLIFDANEKLVGVVMSMAKNEGFGDLESRRFKKTLAALSSKYKLVEKRVPYVGDAYGKFTQGNSTVELIAPHMGFDMELRYMTNSLQKAYVQQSSSAKEQRSREQAGKF